MSAATSTETESSHLPPRVKAEVDKISERKQGLVKKFYEEVWKDTAATHPGWPTTFKTLDEDDARHWCYKLMIARKFDIEQAKAMLMTIIEFRKEHATEDRDYFPPAILMKGYDQNVLAAFFKQKGLREPNEEIDKIHRNMTNAYNPVHHKWTKWGHPVLIESYGHSNPYLLPLKAKLLSPVGKPFTDIAGKYHVHCNEVAVRMTEFQDKTWAKPRGGRVHGMLVIVDVEGLSMAHLGSDNLAMVSTMFAMDKEAYPEFLHKVLVVNCPALIRLAYGLVRPFLDARVQDKISFFAPGDATIEALQEWIDDENIPSHLGGKCKCEGGCVPMPTEEAQAKELAELESGGGAGGKDHLAELGVPVAAGACIDREIEAKAGDEITWEWVSDDERTVEFSAVFFTNKAPAPAAASATPAVEGEGGEPKEVVGKDRITKHSGSYVATEAGKLKLIFSNEFSWMRSKYLTLRSFVVPKSAEDIEVESGHLHHEYPSVESAESSAQASPLMENAAAEAATSSEEQTTKE